MSEINEIYKNYKTKSEIYKINQLKADIKFINDFRQNFEQARLDLGQLNGGQKNKTTIGDTIYQNQKIIKSQLTEFNKSAKNISKSVEKWDKKVAPLTNNLKALGDTENFLAVIDERISKLELENSNS